MAEATPTIQQPVTIRLTTAAALLAQIRARQAVKNQLRREGLKPTHYSARDITVLAQAWLDEHRDELIGPCTAQARAMILSGALGKRAQKAAHALGTDARGAQGVDKAA